MYPPAISDEDRKKLLLAEWDKNASDLMNRDGKDPKFIGGGYNVKENPLLKAAILEIRDGYFKIFWEKTLVALEHSRFHSDFTLKNDDLDRDLIIHNKKSAERLQEPLYGFTLEQTKQILGNDKINRLPPLQKEDAHNIIGSIIKRSINTFNKVSEICKTPDISVPKIPLTQTGKQAGIKPNEAWINKVGTDPKKTFDRS